MSAKKKPNKFPLSFIAVLAFASFCTAVEKPLNITDYLLLIPEKYLGFENLEIPAPERLGMIEENDPQNGWLKLTGKGETTFEGWMELALFSKGPSGPMLGVAVNHCGPVCSQQIFFLRYAPGSWEEITARVFQPLPEEMVKKLYRHHFAGDENGDDPPVLYRLPRRGTDIILVSQEAIAGREVVLTRFRLRDGRFILPE